MKGDNAPCVALVCALRPGAANSYYNFTLSGTACLHLARDVPATNLNVRSRDGFQMAAGWMRAGYLRPGRRLKAPEEGNRGQRRSAMEI